MKILGLDLSTHIGYAVLCSEKGLLKHGTFHVPKDQGAEDCSLDFSIYKTAQNSIYFVHKLFVENKPDIIYVEETNSGRNRWSQKQLEFIHCLLLAWADGNSEIKLSEKIKFVDTSAWRSSLKLRLSKDQSKHNKEVRKAKKTGSKVVGGQARGRITSKHLAVWWSNQTYGLKLKLKDNDAADAIAVASYGLKKESIPVVKIDTETLFTKAFGK